MADEVRGQERDPFPPGAEGNTTPDVFLVPFPAAGPSALPRPMEGLYNLPRLLWGPGCLFPARTLTPPGGFGDGALAMADPPRLEGPSQVRQGGGCPGVTPGAQLGGAPTGAGPPLWGESMCAWSSSLGAPTGKGLREATWELPSSQRGSLGYSLWHRNPGFS